MKTEIYKILNRLSKGEITVEFAYVQIRNLIKYNKDLLNLNAKHGKSRWIHVFDDALLESQNQIEGYMMGLEDLFDLITKNETTN